MAPSQLLLLAILAMALGLLGVAAPAAGQTCTTYDPVSYDAKSKLWKVDPFIYPSTLPGFPFPPCAFAVKGYETKNPDLAGNAIMTAKCMDRIKFVLRPIANLSYIKPAPAEEHGVYVLTNVKNASNPCPRAAECGTKAKGSVPCSKLGWGEKIMPIIEVDKTHAHLSKRMRAYVKYNKKSMATSTTIYFGCPDFIDLGPPVPAFTHCHIGQIIKVVVNHPRGGCK